MDATLLTGFRNALGAENLLYAFIGAVAGTLVGVLPGLGPASALAILLPMTAWLSPTGAIIMLMAIYYGSQYGGSTTAILINVPGEVSSVATCLDGFPLARQGRAAAALGVVAIGSFAAGTASIAALSYLAPALAELSLLFGPPEYFALAAVSLAALASLAEGSVAKGFVAAIVGLALTTVGLDPLDGIPRFTYGSLELAAGFEIVPVLVGLFGIGEVLISLESSLVAIFQGRLGRWLVWPAARDLADSAGAMARGTGLGFVLGLLPGMGASVTSWIAYGLEKRIARDPSRFGKGAIEGVAAPEAANNATAIAGMVPLLAFGLPTVPALAILLAAMQIYGVQTGPLLFTQHAEFTWTVIAAMYVGNVMCLALNLPLVGLWARLVTVPYSVLGPVVLAVCLVAAYAPRNSLFDVWVAVAFGVLGYALRRLHWPMAPLVLGLVLGGTLERALRQSLAMSGGGIDIFFTRPISLGLIAGGAAVVALGLAYRRRGGALGG